MSRLRLSVPGSLAIVDLGPARAGGGGGIGAVGIGLMRPVLSPGGNWISTPKVRAVCGAPIGGETCGRTPGHRSSDHRSAASLERRAAAKRARAG